MKIGHWVVTGSCVGYSRLHLSVSVTFGSCSLARFDGGRAWSASIRTLAPTGFDYDTRKLPGITSGSPVSYITYVMMNILGCDTDCM